jgi:hypothetical protein
MKSVKSSICADMRIRDITRKVCVEVVTQSMGELKNHGIASMINYMHVKFYTLFYIIIKLYRRIMPTMLYQ